MDFVFFAFSSLSVGMIILLMAFILNWSERLIAWRFLFAGLAAGILYYILLNSIARNTLTLYYLLNMAPQIILILTLSVFMKKGSAK